MVLIASLAGLIEGFFVFRMRWIKGYVDILLRVFTYAASLAVVAGAAKALTVGDLYSVSRSISAFVIGSIISWFFPIQDMSRSISYRLGANIGRTYFLGRSASIFRLLYLLVLLGFLLTIGLWMDP
ncbi:MAG: hypothetical protein J7L51_04565 [Desulfurococcales archaeon]|nr:hypothetical protein [Desulfurococcales archaeon]